MCLLTPSTIAIVASSVTIFALFPLSFAGVKEFAVCQIECAKTGVDCDSRAVHQTTIDVLDLAAPKGSCETFWHKRQAECWELLRANNKVRM
jgi:hypothetical protein